MKISKALVILLLAMSTQAYADQFALTVPLATYHIGNNDTNDFNPGVIAQYYINDTDWYVLGGFYMNSDKRESSDDWSFVLGGGYEWQVHKHVKIGLTAGLVSGYTYDTGKTVPTDVYEACDLNGTWHLNCQRLDEVRKKTIYPIIAPTFVIYDLVAITVAPRAINFGIRFSR